MTRLKIVPGACGMDCTVCAGSEDGQMVSVSVDSPCPAISGMMQAIGNELDAYEVCLCRPGTGPLYDYARENFPAHCACPVIAGITKCIEAECGLALPRPVHMEFII